jgi:LPXTG-site transpeptidase (sortase) family protein
MMHKIMKLLGNLLILLSLLFFAAMAYPLIRVYLFPPRLVVAATPSEAFRIVIPAIQAASPVIENVDPWNETVYSQALKHGVAHAKGFALPGENGTVYLFAHSSGPPWEQVYYNTVFLRLGELQRGDEVILERKKKRYHYTVTDKKEVWPNEISYLNTKNKRTLILQTCTPIGTSLKRLLVFATADE